MSLVSKVQMDMLNAMKLRDAEKVAVLKMLLVTFKNKAIDLRVTEVDDATALSLTQKFIKSLQEEEASFEQVGNRQDKCLELKSQIDMISKYLPAMLSEDEIKAEISKLEDKSIPSVMRHFKTNFAGKVDMGLVSRIAKAL